MASKKAPKKRTKKTAAAPRRASRPAARKAKAKVVRKPLKKKKVTKPAARKAAKPAARRAVKKLARPIGKKMARKAAPKATRKPAKPTPPKAIAKRATVKPAARKAPARKSVAAKPAAARKAAAPPPPVRLQRERRRLPEAEAEGFAGVGGDSRLLKSAKSGHDELQSELRQHTEASPELTAGDVDAKWQDAYALGDEAPGGDNMTPDQDRVDDIGKALGIEYDDDEELQGGAELTARDESRWELDPESKEEDEDK